VASDARVAYNNRLSAARVAQLSSSLKGNLLRRALRREAQRVQRDNVNSLRQYDSVLCQNTKKQTSIEGLNYDMNEEIS